MDLNHARLPIPPSGHTTSTLHGAQQARNYTLFYIGNYKLSSKPRNTLKSDNGSSGPDLPPDYDPHVPSRERIMQFMRSAEGPISPKDLAKHMNAKFPLSVGFARRLEAMERDGQLLITPQNMLLLNSERDFISGKVQGHRDGYGFLIRDDKEPDLFLPPREMLKVLHGDKVLARLNGEYRGRPEAVIVEVTDHSTTRLVGRYIQENNSYIVIPEDQRIKHDIVIQSPHRSTAEDGQVVVVEILQQPTRHTRATGKVVEVLGEIDDPGMEIEIAVRKFDVPHKFSEAALEQADKIPDKVAKKDLKGRVDLRDVPFITIDGDDARDFDDAVYCTPVNAGTEKNPRKGWRLLVAIADVSHYVTPDSPIDQDAYERGTSVYFPRRVIPMLPEALSNGICSLNPYEDRLVLVCDMVIPSYGKNAGKVSAYQFYEAVIRSHARTTYDEVWSVLQQPTGPMALKLPHIVQEINNLYELYQILDKQRLTRGAIAFDTVETRIVTNSLGKIESIEPEIRNDAHKLIEECMLAANTCAADYVLRRKRNGLFRVHDGPTPTKLDALRDYLRSQGLYLGGGDDPSTVDYTNLLDQARNRPDFEIVQMMCLRSLQQAVYSPEPEGHFGLAYDHYAHFTSPIRRYPDLLLHRVIKAIISGKHYLPNIEGVAQDPNISRKDHEFGIWERLGMVLSACERRAEEASRDVEAWLKCWFVKEHIGETFSGHITGITSFGIFITLDNLYVEGMVHVSELGSDYFQYNEASHELAGERTGIRYRLTDQVHVQVARVDLEARRIDFRLVKGTSYSALKSANKPETERRIKRAAPAKPAALKGTTASQRRAQAKREQKSAAKAARAAKKMKKTTKK